ncbi:hypothetical protein HMPREF1548_03027 [Clostridium sp. KLE 1755]|nr:hypothetical protein HMPREF1548_03027 [Clostridium sp. KLE 1755]
MNLSLVPSPCLPAVHSFHHVLFMLPVYPTPYCLSISIIEIITVFIKIHSILCSACLFIPRIIIIKVSVVSTVELKLE